MRRETPERIATRLVMHEEQGGSFKAVEKGVYFYHPDHLGSSSVITDKDGGFHEHIEYFPYGEMWVQDEVSKEGSSTPYRFTGKELDKETGFMYYGARYRELRLTGWISPDPILEKYLPTGDKDKDSKLPGMGGVFNTVNLNLYHYGGLNPVKFVDPDGNYVIDRFTLISSIFGENKPKYEIRFHDDDARTCIDVGKFLPSGPFSLRFLAESNPLSDFYFDSSMTNFDTTLSTAVDLASSLGLLKTWVSEGFSVGSTIVGNVSDEKMDKYRKNFLKSAGLLNNKFTKDYNPRILKQRMDTIDTLIDFYRDNIEGEKFDPGFNHYAKEMSKKLFKEKNEK